MNCTADLFTKLVLASGMSIKHDACTVEPMTPAPLLAHLIYEDESGTERSAIVGIMSDIPDTLPERVALACSVKEHIPGTVRAAALLLDGLYSTADTGLTREEVERRFADEIDGGIGMMLSVIGCVRDEHDCCHTAQIGAPYCWDDHGVPEYAAVHPLAQPDGCTHDDGSGCLDLAMALVAA